MLKLPSGGKLGLGMKCMGSFILPQVKSESGIEAEEGKRIHAVLEKHIKSGRTEWPQDELDRAICVETDKVLGPIPGIVERSELGYLVDPSTRSCSFIEEPRTSPPREDERSTGFFGIADYVGLCNPVRARVYDFKTGSGYVADPEWNWQLILPAIGLWYESGRRSDFVCELGIIKICRDGSTVVVHDESVSSHTGSHTDGNGDTGSNGVADSRAGHYPTVTSNIFEATAEFLESRASWLRELSLRAARSTPDSVTLYEGKHCDYCPARDRCPAKVGALAEALKVISMDPLVLESVSDLRIIKTARAIDTCRPMIRKAEISVLERNGNVMDLGDGREAVLAVDGRGKKKIYTRKKSTNEYKQSGVGVAGSEQREGKDKGSDASAASGSKEA